MSCLLNARDLFRAQESLAFYDQWHGMHNMNYARWNNNTPQHTYLLHCYTSAHAVQYQ